MATSLPPCKSKSTHKITSQTFQALKFTVYGAFALSSHQCHATASTWFLSNVCRLHDCNSHATATLGMFRLGHSKLNIDGHCVPMWCWKDRTSSDF